MEMLLWLSGKPAVEQQAALAGWLASSDVHRLSFSNSRARQACPLLKMADKSVACKLHQFSHSIVKRRGGLNGLS